MYCIVQTGEILNVTWKSKKICDIILTLHTTHAGKWTPEFELIFGQGTTSSWKHEEVILWLIVWHISDMKLSLAFLVIITQTHLAKRLSLGQGRGTTKETIQWQQQLIILLLGYAIYSHSQSVWLIVDGWPYIIRHICSESERTFRFKNVGYQCHCKK